MAGFDVIADLLSATRRRLSVLHAACGASEATAIAAGSVLLAAFLTSVAPAGALRAVAVGVGLACERAAPCTTSSVRCLCAASR